MDSHVRVPESRRCWHHARGMMLGVPPHRQPELRLAYPIRTERLLLRPLTISDVDALLAYRGRPDVCRYVPFEPMDRQLIGERLAAQWATIALTHEGQALTLGI